jgi:hypothetical protein
MNRFQREGVWRPLTRSQRRRAEQEYSRVLRMQAGAAPGVPSESVQNFCQYAFGNWEQSAEELQMQLVREVCQFHLANRRFCNNQNAREVFLHQFLARLRQRVRSGNGVVYPSCLAYLNQYAPGWMHDVEELESLVWLQSLAVDSHFDRMWTESQ